MADKVFFEVRDRTDDNGAVVSDLWEITLFGKDGEDGRLEKRTIQNAVPAQITDAIARMEMQISEAELTIDRSEEHIGKLLATKDELIQRKGKRRSAERVALGIDRPK